jgi:hypothetical protein
MAIPETLLVRPECGTPAGALAHQYAGEPWCGWCRHAERVAAAEAEGLAMPYWYAPVTPERARSNLLTLAQALDGFEESGAA